MTPRIVSIGTAVPSTSLRQSDVRDFFEGQQGIDRRTQRIIHAAFDAAAIDRRHSVLTQLDDPSAAPAGALDFVDADGALLSPSTGSRNGVYELIAPGLSAEAAQSALDRAGVGAAQVTHVVTVSCTGFFAPGPDYRLVRDLGLSPSAQRYHLGFIGCAAALPALRLAAQITTADPSAVVLVVCVELCSIHIRASTDPEQIVAASVFADGAAAAVVTADPRHHGGRGLELDRFATTLTDEGETDMVWTIGDEGFEMTLTAEVPRIIGREIRGAVDAFLDGESPDTWAVHPGGRSILDRVQAGLELDEDALAVSRDILRAYGNMSSATILFILERLLRSDGLDVDARTAALAFGPGLTVEAALLTMREGTSG